MSEENNPSKAYASNDWRMLENMDSLPLMKSGYSLESDMKFGWRP